MRSNTIISETARKIL